MFDTKFHDDTLFSDSETSVHFFQTKIWKFLVCFPVHTLKILSINFAKFSVSKKCTASYKQTSVSVTLSIFIFYEKVYYVLSELKDSQMKTGKFEE